MIWDVLHIITKLELGGAQLATLCEVERSSFVSGQRHLAFGPGGLLDARARELMGVELHELTSLGRAVRPGAELFALFEIARLVRRLKRPEARLIVHTHSSKAGVLGRLGAYLGGADVIIHSIHGFGHSHHGRRLTRAFFWLLEKVASLVTTGFTADSHANIEEGRRDGLLGKRPCQVVHCGVALASFARSMSVRKEARAELGIKDEERVVLTLACLKPQKDPLTFARVAAKVAAQAPRAVFLLAGDGELRPALEDFIGTRGLSSRLRLLGWRHDVSRLLAAADVFLLTSRFEGLPQAIIQAMAAGLPVVATRVDGNGEAVREGETGLLCAPGDVEGLSAAVLALVTDDERCARMGRAALVRCAPFSEEQMLAGLDAFYARVTRS